MYGDFMYTGIPEPARLILQYSVVVMFSTGSGELCTKVMNVDGRNFVEENRNI